MRVIECWTLDRSYTGDSDYKTRDFALFIDLLLGIVRPWTLHKIEHFAALFFEHILPTRISKESKTALRSFTDAYLRGNIRWSWPEAQPALRTAFKVLLELPTFPEPTTAYRDLPPGDSVLIPYLLTPDNHMGYGGLTGVMRSLLVAINMSATTLHNNKNTYSMSWPTWIDLWDPDRPDTAMYILKPGAVLPPAPLTSPIVNTLLSATNLTGEHHLLIKRLSTHTAATFRTWTQGYTDKAYQIWPEPEWEHDLSPEQVRTYAPLRDRNPLHQRPENPQVPALWYRIAPRKAAIPSNRGTRTTDYSSGKVPFPGGDTPETHDTYTLRRLLTPFSSPESGPGPDPRL